MLWTVALEARAEQLLHARVALMRLLLPRRLDETPLPELLRELTPTSSGAVPTGAQVARIHRVTETMLRESSIARTTCLYRSLIRYVLLREIGMDVTFVMGVRNKGADIVGHAWLESEQRPFMEALDHEYSKTFVHPA